MMRLVFHLSKRVKETCKRLLAPTTNKSQLIHSFMLHDDITHREHVERKNVHHSQKQVLKVI